MSEKTVKLLNAVKNVLWLCDEGEIVESEPSHIGPLFVDELRRAYAAFAEPDGDVDKLRSVLKVIGRMYNRANPFTGSGQWEKISDLPIIIERALEGE